jgi:hypothetical protein
MQRDLGQASFNVKTARPQTTEPAAAAVAARSVAS